MGFESVGKLVQIAAAALGIPAAAAGTYTVYQNYFTNELACQRLRTNIISTMEKNVPADAKRSLLRKDVNEFVQKCGEQDIEARTLFVAALKEDARVAAMPASAPPTKATGIAAAPASQTIDGVASSFVAMFGRSPAGEMRGWVALTRAEPARLGEANFDGYALSLTELPPPGTVLRPRHVIPVWSEPQHAGNDDTKLQGRVALTGCLRVVTTRPAEGRSRTWGEVVPAPCPPALMAAGK